MFLFLLLHLICHPYLVFSCELTSVVALAFLQRVRAQRYLTVLGSGGAVSRVTKAPAGLRYGTEQARASGHWWSQHRLALGHSAVCWIIYDECRVG